MYTWATDARFAGSIVEDDWTYNQIRFLIPSIPARLFVKCHGRKSKIRNVTVKEEVQRHSLDDW